MTTRTGRLTPEELREQHGLEIYETIQGLTGKHPERGIVKREFHEEILGVERGQVLAMPPANPNPRDTQVRWNRERYKPQWVYRVEGPHWQADLFIQRRERNPGKPGIRPIRPARRNRPGYEEGGGRNPALDTGTQHDGRGT